MVPARIEENRRESCTPSPHIIDRVEIPHVQARLGTKLQSLASHSENVRIRLFDPDDTGIDHELEVLTQARGVQDSLHTSIGVRNHADAVTIIPQARQQGSSPGEWEGPEVRDLMGLAHPLAQPGDPLLRNTTRTEEPKKVPTPQFWFGPGTTLGDPIVKNPTSAKFMTLEVLRRDPDTLGCEDLDHAEWVEMHERVSGIEQDGPNQKKTGSLYEPKTSSIAARISYRVQ